MTGGTISAVIPAHNEGGRIGDVVRASLPHVEEVIVVDDSSGDDTGAEASEAGARVLRNETNLGYIGSIKRGFRAARGEVVVTLDADGEHDPADIPTLVAPILEGRADAVFGMRDTVPRPSERLINWLVRRRAGGLRDTGTGFRAMRRDLALGLRLEGACTCGILALEMVSQGARLEGVRSDARPVVKPRRVAWEHLGQAIRVTGMMLRR